jgi:hypothetical protein
MHCKHDKCHCHGEEVLQDGYCSANCRRGEMNDEGKCACGHPDCQ